MYRLTITKTEPNVNYDKELAALDEMNKYRMRRSIDEPIYSEPQREVVNNLMYVMLTDEQYEAVKQAVLAEFK